MSVTLMLDSLDVQTTACLNHRVYSIDPAWESAVRVSWSRPALYFHVCLLYSDPLRAFFYKISYFFLTEIKENRICSGDPKMELKVAFVPP